MKSDFCKRIHSLRLKIQAQNKFDNFNCVLSPFNFDQFETFLDLIRFSIAESSKHDDATFITIHESLESIFEKFQCLNSEIKNSKKNLNNKLKGTKNEIKFTQNKINLIKTHQNIQFQFQKMDPNFKHSKYKEDMNVCNSLFDEAMITNKRLMELNNKIANRKYKTNSV